MDISTSSSSSLHQSKPKMTGILLTPPSQKFMEAMLLCPICKSFSGLVMYECKAGHFACENCHKKGKKCPMPNCNEKHQGTLSSLYEAFVDGWVFNCSFVSQGCSTKYKLKEKGHHEERCKFRPLDCYNCRRDGNPTMIEYLKFLEHQKNHAGFTITNASSDGRYIWSVTTPENMFDQGSKMITWQMNAISFRGKTFFQVLHGYGPPENPSVGIFLWVLGDDREANRFEAKISVGNLTAESNRAKSVKRLLTWEGEVHSIREPLDIILQEGMCFHVSLAAFRNFGQRIGVQDGLETSGQKCLTGSGTSLQCFFKHEVFFRIHEARVATEPRTRNPIERSVTATATPQRQQ